MPTDVFKKHGKRIARADKNIPSEILGVLYAPTKSARDLKIEALAKEHLFFETLETRRSGVDFHEVSVWGVKAALEAAYQAGYEAAKRKP